MGRSIQVCLWLGMECMPLRVKDIREDLEKRDFTINALALEVDVEKLHTFSSKNCEQYLKSLTPSELLSHTFIKDHTQSPHFHYHPLALVDLQQGILRAAAPATFQDDPLRIFRLARFAAHLPHFTIAPETFASARHPQTTRNLQTLPKERVGREVLKSLTAPKPSLFLKSLHEMNALLPWFAEFTNAATIPAGPPQWHTESVLGHTGTIMDAVAGDPTAVWMALCHDIGKASTLPDILPHHYMHEHRGEKDAQKLGTRLALATQMIRAGALAARLHMKAGKYHSLRIGTRRDLLWQVHRADMFTPFWKVVCADSKHNLLPHVTKDLEILRNVSLPQEWCNKGIASAELLRTLQCAALAAHKHQEST